MSALFDFPSLIVVLLLFIASATYLRTLYPTIFDTATGMNGMNGMGGGMASSAGANKEHAGIYGVCWKASRIGERLSPYVAGASLLMAVHILFFKG